MHKNEFIDKEEENACFYSKCMGISQGCFCAFAVEAAKYCGSSMEWENRPPICVPEASKWRRLPWTESRMAFAKAGLSPLAEREDGREEAADYGAGKGGL